MKLLNKTIRSYLIYSFTILLVTIPLFYFVVKSVLLHAVDKSLKTQLRDIRSNLSSIHSQDELETWSKLDKDINLSSANENFQDYIYTTYRFNRRHHGQDPYREIAGPISVGGNLYRLVISSSLVENEDLLGSIVLVEGILLILLMAGMLWINQRTSQKIWQPFHRALNNMQQFELNKHTELPFLPSNTDEFNELNKAIVNLFNRNHETYLLQKEFTENASHEMQTPLAIFQTKLDLLMQTSPLSEDQAELIHALETTNHRLIRLNKSLLLLAKIENDQFRPTESINIMNLTKRLTDQVKVHAAEKGIAIVENYIGSPLVKANNTLIEILVGNLLSNAIRYNVENGEIILTLEENSLDIQNTGQGSPLQADKIFDRFHKENQSSSNAESTGLGLAIVKKICDLYQYRIQYSFANNMHRFELVLTRD